MAKHKVSKSSMSFLTALNLSFRNLMTKKTRTILTAIAGSIGIIGIALILALASGFQAYVDKVQADTLSNYPLSIKEDVIDTSNVMGMMENEEWVEYPEEDYVYVNKVMERLQTLYRTNLITESYIEDVIENIDPSLYNDITYERSVNLAIYAKNYNSIIDGYQVQKINTSYYGQKIWQELLNNQDFLDSQYDLISGSWPTSKDEIVLVINKYNQIPDVVLMLLGLYDINSTTTKISFEDFYNKEFKLLTNNDCYYQDTVAGKELFKTYTDNNVLYDNGLSLKIVGVIRPNSDTDISSMTGLFGYSSELTDYVIDINQQSEIVEWQKNHPTLDALTGDAFIATEEDDMDSNIRKFGADASITAINIYPVDYHAKDEIKSYLNAKNQELNAAAVSEYYTSIGKTPATATSSEQAAATAAGIQAEVQYEDLMDLVFTSISTVIDAISYVLIAFTSISLVVSSVMIGIITYISVLERIKEIGILRSLGARKKDISRVFNAETLVIGFAAGVFGVGITYLLSIPINLILNSLVGISNIASLNIVHALMLVLISMVLTFISGLIPARIAANKDPVEALRSE